jgi:hypothetical protein
MSEERTENQSANAARGAGGGDVTGLLQTLQQLSRRILSLLWAGRLEDNGYRQGGEDRSIDISGLLYEYIDQTLVESGGQSSGSPESETVKLSTREDSPAAGRGAGGARITPASGTFQELSSHLNKKRRSRSIQPQLGEQFRERTWKHIREAASYAREGNGEAARLHAELAGHSMEEAYRYMSAEEFEKFRRKVEMKLRKRGDPA